MMPDKLMDEKISEIGQKYFGDKTIRLDYPREIWNEAVKAERERIGEQLLDLYDACPEDKRITLFERIIEQLIKGENPEGRGGGE
jgi:hypothetical protein